MAKPYREGLGWSFRLRMRGQDVYRSGYPTEAAAVKAQAELRVELGQGGKASGQGPFQTSLAAAFLKYAEERLRQLDNGNKRI